MKAIQIKYYIIDKIITKCKIILFCNLHITYLLWLIQNIIYIEYKGKNNNSDCYSLSTKDNL